MPQEGFAEHSAFFLQQVEQPVIMDTAQMSATNVMVDFIFWFDVQAARSSPNRLVRNRSQPASILA